MYPISPTQPSEELATDIVKVLQEDVVRCADNVHNAQQALNEAIAEERQARNSLMAERLHLVNIQARKAGVADFARQTLVDYEAKFGKALS